MVDVVEDQDDVTFEEFCNEWSLEFREGNLPPTEKGRRFALKLVTQWLQINADDLDDDNLVLCDGPGDGGIDIAYLHEPDVDDAEPDGQFVEGHTWFLVQSKYGTAFQGTETILNDGHKVIATLAGENTHLSEQATQLVERLNTFRQQASERDRLILVFATEKPMSETDRKALDAVKQIGAQHFPNLFDVDEISLQTIWELRTTIEQLNLQLPIEGNFVDPDSGLRVGTITLTDLYAFLRAFREKTGNLDQLYEKNVRQFLGSRKKVNKYIADTLKETPELFGLYNNGITIVVTEYVTRSDKSCLLTNPYIVNGCQTTKTIWEVLRQKLDSGGTGESQELKDWQQRAERGVVLAKIVKSDGAQITNITRYTNSQNAVREQDFLALRNDFGTWKDLMASQYGIFLEIQRGGQESQRAFQKSHPSSFQFTEFANAFELIKVYGSGWMREPGTAFGKNAPFLPEGSIFKRIVSGDDAIRVDDLHAAFLLQRVADGLKFGRNASNPSRRQTRYLFYFILLDLLRDTLIRTYKPDHPRNLTMALLALLKDENPEAFQGLTDASLEVVSEYLNQSSEDSVYKEPNFTGDLNTFLKREQLGRNEDSTPRFKSLLTTHKLVFGRSSAGQPSPRESVINVISSQDDGVEG